MLHILYIIYKKLDSLFHLDKTDDEVTRIKQNAIEKISNTNDILKEAAQLQTRIIKKTATYYIGTAMGGKFE